MTPPPRDGARASAASASASSPSPHLTVWASVLSGALAACGAVLFTNVPETVKVRLQLDGEGAARGAARQYASLRDAVSKIVRQEGALALQAGLRPALIYQAIMNGCRLGLYEPMQRGVSAAAGGAAPPGSTAAKVLASAASGVVGVVLGNPFFLVKTRLQAASRHFVAREAHDYAGMLDGLAKVARREGLGGFARGLSAAIPRVVAASVTQLVSFDHARELARGPSVGLTGAFPQVIFASALSAVATVTALNPFDVVATRLYQSAGVGTKYSGPIDCAMHMARKEGYGTFMRGWTANFARLGPHTVLCFLFLEAMRPVFMSIDYMVVR